MDKLRNPFAPGAGNQPLALVRFFSLIQVKTLLALFILASSALATSVKLTGPEIGWVLHDTTLYAGGNGEIEQVFQSSGQTVYIEQGHYAQGSWFVEGDQYCSRWPPGVSKSCFDVTRDGDTITFISSGGTRYPMRTKK